MIDYQEVKYKLLIVSEFNSQDIKTRFRLVEGWGVGRKRVLRGGRFMVGTPSPSLYRHLLPLPSPPHINIFSSHISYICKKQIKHVNKKIHEQHGKSPGSSTL